MPSTRIPLRMQLKAANARVATLEARIRELDARVSGAPIFNAKGQEIYRTTPGASWPWDSIRVRGLGGQTEAYGFNIMNASKIQYTLVWIPGWHMERLRRMFPDETALAFDPMNEAQPLPVLVEPGRRIITLDD